MNGIGTTLPVGVRDANHVGTFCTDSVDSINGIFDTSTDTRNMPTASVRETNVVGTIMNDVGETLPEGVREMNDVGTICRGFPCEQMDTGTTCMELPSSMERIARSGKEMKNFE